MSGGHDECPHDPVGLVAADKVLSNRQVPDWLGAAADPTAAIVGHRRRRTDLPVSEEVGWTSRPVLTEGLLAPAAYPQVSYEQSVIMTLV